MKYLIDYHYKVINSVAMCVYDISASCKNGEATRLRESLDFLKTKVSDLETMIGPPYEKRHLALIEELNRYVKQILHLPDHIDDLSSTILTTCKSLLSELQPFSLDFDENAQEQKKVYITYLSLLKKEMEEIFNLLLKQKKFKQETLGTIKEVLQEINRLGIKSLKSQEAKIIQFVVEKGLKFCQTRSEDLGYFFYQKILLALFIFNDSNLEENSSVLILLSYLYESFLNLENEIRQKPDIIELAVADFFNATSDQVIEALRNCHFSQMELNQGRDQIILIYERAKKQNKTCATSAVETLALFGSELLSLYQMLIQVMNGEEEYEDDDDD